MRVTEATITIVEHEGRWFAILPGRLPAEIGEVPNRIESGEALLQVETILADEDKWQDAKSDAQKWAGWERGIRKARSFIICSVRPQSRPDPLTRKLGNVSKGITILRQRGRTVRTMSAAQPMTIDKVISMEAKKVTNEKSKDKWHARCESAASSIRKRFRSIDTASEPSPPNGQHGETKRAAKDADGPRCQMLFEWSATD